MTSNEAAYGATLATPGASLRGTVDSMDPTTTLRRMTTNNYDILAPLRPKVELLDWYGSVVKGKFAKDVEVKAILLGDRAKPFGATVTKVSENGTTLFIDLGIQGRSGSGPHIISFEASSRTSLLKTLTPGKKKKRIYFMILYLFFSNFIFFLIFSFLFYISSLGMD